MMRRELYRFILLVLPLLFYLIIGMAGDLKSHIGMYFLLILPLYLLYGYLVYCVLRSKAGKYLSFTLLIIFGIFFRLSLLFSDPFLSDDVYRYLWDGRVSAAGINPYAHTPESIELFSLRDEEVYPEINFPNIGTVYPPVSQFFFLLNEWCGGTLPGWKILLLLLELSSWFCLIKLLDYFSLDRFRLMIFIYNPLLIIETYQSGHLEIIGIIFFWIAVYLFYKKWEWRSLGFYFMAIMTKFLPFFSGLPFLRDRFWRKLLLVVLLLALFLLPYTSGGTLPLPGLYSYLNRWEFNGAAFKLCVWFLKLLNVPESELITANLSGHNETFYLSFGLYYKGLALLVYLFIMISRWQKLAPLARFRTISFIQASFFLTASLLLLIPTLYPWYLIWIIPFLIFLPSLSWLSLTFLIQLSYYILSDYALRGIWQETSWILLIEYLPFYLMLIVEFRQSDRIKGWLIT